MAGLSLFGGLAEKASAVKIEGINFSSGFNYALPFSQTRNFTDNDINVPIVLVTDTTYDTSILSLNGKCKFMLNEGWCISLEELLDINSGSLARTFGWTAGSANGSYSDSQNYLKLAFGKEIDAENCKLFPYGGFAAISEAEREKINENFEDYNLYLVNTERVRNTGGLGFLIGIKAESDRLNDWIFKGAIERAFHLNGKRTFRSDSEISNVIRGYNVSSDGWNISVQVSKQIDYNKLIEEIFGEIEFRERSSNINQTSTNEASSQVYENYNENRTDLTVSSWVRFKSGLEAGLGIGSRGRDSKGTLIEKTLSRPYIFIRANYRRNFDLKK